MVKQKKDSNHAIAFTSVSKKFGGRFAVRDVTLSVEPSRVHALVGPLGSGKSTLCKLAVGLLRPSRGKVTLNCSDSSRVGYASHDMRPYPKLTGAQYLKFISHLRGAKEYQHLEPVRKKLAVNLDVKINKLSEVDKRKIVLLGALMDDPDILIFDGLTSGLNPVESDIFNRVLREFTRRGKAVLVTTNNLAEVDDLADAVSFLDKGRVIETVTLRSLKLGDVRTVKLVGQTRGLKLLAPPDHFDATIIKHNTKEIVFQVAQIDGRLLRWIAMQPIGDMVVTAPALHDFHKEIYSQEGKKNV